MRAAIAKKQGFFRMESEISAYASQIAAPILTVLLAASVAIILVQRKQLSATRDELRSALAVRTDLECRLAAADERSMAVPALTAEIRELRCERDNATNRALGLEGDLKATRREHQARLEELNRIQAEIATRFNEVASNVLDRNAERFLHLANERYNQHRQTAEADLTRRQTEIANLLKPVQENLSKFEKQVGEIEQKRAGAYEAITTQVNALALGQASLTQETARLVQALRAPKTRGRWGEFQLRQVFEMAGLLDQVDFVLEHHITTDGDSALRPDAVVRMPGGKSLVVDAKTPLDAYLNAIEARDPDSQRAEIARHVLQIKAHVQQLSAKSYWAALPATPDFVVMFVPGEAFYAAALENDPSLVEFAFAKRVLIASPTTLIALLRSVAHGWQQEKLTEDAQAIADTARDLYTRIKTFGSHLEGVGSALRKAVECYNKTVGSLESRVLPAARKLETLKVPAQGDRIDSLTLVEQEPRVLTAVELLTPHGAEPASPIRNSMAASTSSR